MRVLLAAALLFLACAAPAEAHTRSQSQSSWRIDGDAIEVLVEADAVDVTRLYALGGEEPLADRFAAEAAAGLTVSANDQQCMLASLPRQSLRGSGRVSAALRFSCPLGALADGAVTIHSQLFLRVAPSHLHFVSIRDTQDRSAEAVLTETNPSATLALRAPRANESFWGALARFAPIGAEHVWSGIDHIAFILALVLLVGGRLRPAIFAATGFTLGHTATLGLAATGVLRPDTTAIEALIGFTVAFVALEIGNDGVERLRRWSAALAALLGLGGFAAMLGWLAMSPLIWFGLAAFVVAYPRSFPRGAAWIAAAFGLIHGCGFAGAIAELDLPPQRMIASLLGFNLGVELGQIVVIAAALLIAQAAQRLPASYRSAAVTTSGAALFALGAYWFVSRLL